MRIGIDARFYGSVGKGLGRYTEKLIEYLEESDRENRYFIFLRKENFEEYQPKNANFTKVLADYPWYSFSEQIKLPWKLAIHRLDLVHFPHFNVPLFYWRRFIVTIHDLILLHYPTLRATTHSALIFSVRFLVYRLVIGSALRRAAHVITVSEFTLKDLQSRYHVPDEKITVTREAADPFCHIFSAEDSLRFFTRIGLLSGKKEGQTLHDILSPYILYVGNAYPHKNLEALLEAAPAFPDHRFVFVGKEDYFYVRLKKKAQALAVKNVLFTGYVTDQELGALYRHALLYVFPSLYEGFGLPPLEAMTYGLPVLASRRGSLPEILGHAAAFFDPKDTESLITALRSLLTDPDQRRELCERGYHQAAQYRWRDMAEVTQKLYRS